ncbi:MAG: hypothetical protein ACLS4S_05045 [Bacteroides nordii]
MKSIKKGILLCLWMFVFVLLSGCKDDEKYPYPIGEKLINYETKLFKKVYGVESPIITPETYLMMTEYPELTVGRIQTVFHFNNVNYIVSDLSLSELELLEIPTEGIGVVFTGEFIPVEVIAYLNSGEMSGNAVFKVQSLTLK